MMRTTGTGITLQAGIRQLQAVRDAAIWSISGNALPIGVNDPNSLGKWLESQGLNDPGQQCGTPPPGKEDTFECLRGRMVNRAVHDYMGVKCPELIYAGAAAPMPEDDFGGDRSGAGWNRGAHFCMTSALVRLLGALEQFELDVLKALLYYRPAGVLGHKLDMEEIRVAENVIRETDSLLDSGS